MNYNFEQFYCLDEIIYKESRWNPKAKNGSHYGIPQGRSKYLAKVDGYKQILRYDEKGEPYYVYFEKATVSAIAHQFFKKNLQHTTNLQHEIPVTGVTVVESWIKEGKHEPGGISRIHQRQHPEVCVEVREERIH